MPTSNINQDELSLLAYMHEHAEGYTSEFPIDLEAAVKDLDLTREKFIKDLSYLVAHHLAAWKTLDTTTSQGRRFHLQRFWLTGLGEDYMRDLENQPGVAKRVTTTVVKEGWDFIKTTAADLLKSYMVPG